MSAPRLRLALAAAGLAMGVFCALRIDLGSDVTRFLPDDEEVERVRISRRLAESELTRTLVLTVGAATPERAVEVARALARRLADHPEVAWIRSGTDPEEPRAFYALYFPRRHGFLSGAPERELPQLLSDAGLRARARALRRELASPASTLLGEIAGADPLGAFPRILERVRALDPGLRVLEGALLSSDGRWAVVLLGTRHSAFDAEAQAPLLDAVEAAFAEVAAGPGEPARLEWSGIHRFSVAVEREIRGDTALVGGLSFACVVALFLGYFRSIGALGLALLPALGGILVAATLGLLVFGDLDGLTLAFGASLIGVTIDYPVHLLSRHRVAGGAQSPAEVARSVRPSLVLGAGTTMAGFAGLGLTSFPGFREIAFFSVTGVLAALGLTLWVLPPLLDRPAPATALSRWTEEWLWRALAALRRRRRMLVGLSLLVVLAALALAPRLRFIDDLQALSPLDPELLAEDRRVRARISSLETGRLVLALGRDAEEALQRNEHVQERLARAVEAGAVEGVRSLHALLWSEDLQRRNLEQLRAQPDLAGRVERAFEAEGFRAGAFARFRADLEAAPPAPLRAAELRGTPLERLVSAHLLELGGRVAVATYLRGVRSADALSAALAGLPDVWVFDQRRFLDELYAEFRATTLQQLAVGTLLVLALLALRYRDLRRTLAAFLPCVLVTAALLAGFAALGIEMNLIHAVSLVMVTGMSVDFGIFLVDSARDPDELRAALVSVWLACLTTLLPLGVLALASHPALRSIGASAGAAILLSLLFAPVALVVSRDA